MRRNEPCAWRDSVEIDFEFWTNHSEQHCVFACKRRIFVYAHKITLDFLSFKPVTRFANASATATRGAFTEIRPALGCARCGGELCTDRRRIHQGQLDWRSELSTPRPLAVGLG